jgi:hypothetical protein
MPRIPQIGALEAGQQTIQVVAGRIRPGPRVRALIPPSTPHSMSAPTPALGRRHYENSLVRQFAALHAKRDGHYNTHIEQWTNGKYTV